MTTEKYIDGTVKNIIFQNQNSFYKILAVKINDTDLDWHEDSIVVTGNFGDIKESEDYHFIGHLVEHPRYGMQFQATQYHLRQRDSKASLINYLASNRFNGIGKKTATKIVDQLGLNAIDQILDDQHVLDNLGLSSKQQQNLLTALQDNHGIEQIIIELNNLGFGNTLAYKIYNKYRLDTLNVIHDNPYQLIGEIPGVGFKRADNIAFKQGIAPNAPMRLQGGLLATLTNLTVDNGDTYALIKDLLVATAELLESNQNVAISYDELAQQLIALGKHQKVIIEQQSVYLPSLYTAEVNIAQHLYRLVNADDLDNYNDETFNKAIYRLEKRNQIVYDDLQQKVLKEALQHHIYLLTGGPGTGKTTLIKGIVELFAQLHHLSLNINDYHDKPFPVLLAAPTGRAAKHMNEMTGLPASTIHRLLGLTGQEDESQLADEALNELSGGLLIIDEMSMVDTFLFYSLIKAIPDDMQVILVGDKNQLPSVGPGQVFADLLASKALPSQTLQHIYRQDDDSSIITLAHEINSGQIDDNFFKNYTDRSFFACQPQQVPAVVGQVVAKAKKRGFDIQEIQVLAPMYKGPAGIDELNKLTQNILNPLTPEHHKNVEFGDVDYRIGDKVIHLVNSPDLNVFNGEIGEITSITYAKDNQAKSDSLTIQFAENEVTYLRKDWNKIAMAYCTSIHKAQGSEFDVVILPLVTRFQHMLQRQLLYTAVTRAKHYLIMLGEPQAFITAVKQQANQRQTSLQQRIEKIFNITKTSSTNNDAKDYQLTPQLIQNMQIDPMIGMQGVTPYTFMNE